MKQKIYDLIKNNYRVWFTYTTRYGTRNAAIDSEKMIIYGPIKRAPKEMAGLYLDAFCEKRNNRPWLSDFTINKIRFVKKISNKKSLSKN